MLNVNTSETKKNTKYPKALGTCDSGVYESIESPHCIYLVVTSMFISIMNDNIMGIYAKSGAMTSVRPYTSNVVFSHSEKD